MPPKHRGKRIQRQARVMGEDDDQMDSEEKTFKTPQELLTQRVEDLRSASKSHLSNVQFILATLSIAVAVYLLLQNSSVIRRWRPALKQAPKDQFGRLRDHRYVESRPDGLSWSGPSRVSSALQDVAPQNDGGWRNASKQVWTILHTTRSDVVRKSAKKMNLKKFEGQYQNKKPLLLRFPGGAKDWVESDLWSHDSLTKIFAEWEKQALGSHGSQPVNDTDLSTFDKFISQSASGPSKELPFVFSPAFFESTSLRNSVHTPDYLNSSYYESPNSVVFGISMSAGQFHRQTDSWIGLVYGYKRWFLFPPEQAPPGGSDLDVADWYRRIRPRLEATEMPMECILGPGDILYIPDSWYHGSISMGDTIGIGFRKLTNERCMSNLTEQIEMIKADETLDKAAKVQAVLPLVKRLHGAYPTNTEVLNKLGQLHAARGELNDAVQALDSALFVDPFFMKAYLNLAKIYASAGDSATADEYFRLAEFLNPHSFDVCALYGEFLVTQNRSEDAVQLFQTGAAYNPEEADFFDHLAKQAQIPVTAE